MKKRVLSVLLSVAVVAAMVVGCGSKSAESTDTAKEETTTEASADKDKTYKIGVRSDGIDQFNVVKDEIEAAGYKVEAVTFDDSIQPNVALAEGSIDANWYQHGPYLENYNAENNTDLVMVEPKTAYPLFAMYSTKIKSVDDLKKGGTIGLCTDATNKARGLKMLEAQGLIKLDSSVDVPTQYDIKENPYNLEFIEAEMQVLPQSLGDVEGICLAAAHMVNAGYDANDFVCQSDDSMTYAVGFVVRPEDKDAQWVKDIAAAVQCDDLATYFKDEKKGTMVPTWK